MFDFLSGLRDVLYRLTHSLVSSSTVLNEVSLHTSYLLNIGLLILLDSLRDSCWCAHVQRQLVYRLLLAC
jgi:hypothetical protein